MRSLSWIFGLALLAASVVGANWAINGPYAQESKKSKTVTADIDLPPMVYATGWVAGEKPIASLNPIQPGQIVFVASEGTKLKEGDVILKVDDRFYALKVQEAKAALDEAKELVTQAGFLADQIKAKRQQIAAGIDAIKQMKLAKEKKFEGEIKWKERDVKVAQYLKDAHELEMKGHDFQILIEKAKEKELDAVNPEAEKLRAEAGVNAKKAQLDLAKYAFDQCVLKAPSNGVILRANVTKGEVFAANPQMAAIEFLPDSPRIIRGEIPQEWASKIQSKQEVLIEDDTQAGPTWEGRVRSVADVFQPKRRKVLEPFFQNDIRTLECIIEVTKGDHQLRIDQRVRLKIKI